ncbi:MAG: hypothetical protein K0R24_2091 [Gammaproteobacteria bacterium]|nr:hypothetical protein [Gammaproteobacteria bacterium]
MTRDKEKVSLYDWVIHPDVIVSITKSPQEKMEDAKLRRFKERWLFITTMFVVIGMFVVCGAFVFLTFRTNSEYTGSKRSR